MVQDEEMLPLINTLQYSQAYPQNRPLSQSRDVLIGQSQLANYFLKLQMLQMITYISGLTQQNNTSSEGNCHNFSCTHYKNLKYENSADILKPVPSQINSSQ